jgi:hypothetical protein
MDWPLDFPNNRYAAIEEIRTLLGFTKAEWKALLRALSKTDNGWLQYMFGNVTLDFKKFVDIDEVHILIEKKTRNKSTESLKYVFELSDFIKPKAKNP